MKKKFIILTVFLSILSANTCYSQDYICFYMINAEIKNTMQEHEKQKDMRTKQLGNLASEEVNDNKWTEFKSTSAKIRGRLNNVSLAIQAIPSSATITREINKIYEIQSKIYQELEDAPIWIATALQGQYEFIDMLQMNMRLMAGIVLSYGTINQMEKAERQSLLDFAAGEMKSLRILSHQTLTQIRIAKRKKRQREGMLANWINQDKKLINDIIKNAKNL